MVQQGPAVQSGAEHDVPHRRLPKPRSDLRVLLVSLLLIALAMGVVFFLLLVVALPNVGAGGGCGGG